MIIDGETNLIHYVFNTAKKHDSVKFASRSIITSLVHETMTAYQCESTKNLFESLGVDLGNIIELFGSSNHFVEYDYCFSFSSCHCDFHWKCEG